MIGLRNATWLPLRVSLCLGLGGFSLLSEPGPSSAADDTRQALCRIAEREGRIELRSPAFTFVLETADGLRARVWTNVRTGAALSFGASSELGTDFGVPGGPVETPKWTVASWERIREGAEGEVRFRLAGDRPGLSAVVTYQWTAAAPVLRKLTEITNAGPAEARLLDVRLGSYETSARLEEREQGFPVYLDGEFFMSLAHPAGWAAGNGGRVRLEQHPGVTIPPMGSFRCMEAVYGVGQKPGGARTAFVEHVRSRMRRTVRHHDHPYVIFDNFGSWFEGENHQYFVQNTEAHMLHSLGRLAAFQEATGCRFDLCNIHFWVDHAGDLYRFDPRRFPNGIQPINKVLDRLGIAPGLWIDSSMGGWSIGRNPAAAPSLSDDKGFFCRASEPIRSMYLEAFRRHIREHGVRLIKFDNLRTVCNEKGHGHLPGVYSTEAIENSVISFLNALDAECPEVFLILYWGHRSPWWLLHGDTLFDSGIGIEAASPSSQPAPHARDSITQKLDQAQEHSRDIPPLGKDSLGVWLSDWGWNSSVGKERWPEGVVMDMARGSLLIQLWADRDWLSPAEWPQLADLIALLRARPECFARPRPILGSPSRDEPYGYSCADGRRALFAIHNASWKDSAVPLNLSPAWGLPAGQRWDLYRWYPDPARLTCAQGTFGELASIALRPFEVVLIEAVPTGQAPSLDRKLQTRPIPVGFDEASRDLDLEVGRAPEPPPAEQGHWTVLRPRSAASAGRATLVLQPDGSVLASGKCPSPDTYTIIAETELDTITGIRVEALPDPSLPSGGPGRCYNGNFALAEFVLTAEPKGDHPPAAPIPVPFGRALADFSQTTFGGWPVAAAIDGEPKTAWSIHPQANVPHTAVLEARKAFGFRGGARLTFKILQGYVDRSPDHTLGKLRLSVTGDTTPLQAPESHAPRPVVVRLAAPPSQSDGMIVVSAEMKRDGQPASLGDIGNYFSAEATVSGAKAASVPVLGKATYPSSWQAWRIPVNAAPASRPVELAVTTTFGPEINLSWRAHFLPGPKSR